MTCHPVVIAFGGNLASPWGSPAATFRAAADRLAARALDWQAFSPLYETAPLPAGDQPWFVNAIALGRTALGPHELLSEMSAVEGEAGRVRRRTNDARPLDLDLIDYDSMLLGQPGDRLVLPHPRLDRRAFVLRPLFDLLPDWRHPRTGRPVRAMLEDSGVREQQIRRAALDW